MIKYIIFLKNLMLNPIILLYDLSYKYQLNTNIILQNSNLLKKKIIIIIFTVFIFKKIKS